MLKTLAVLIVLQVASSCEKKSPTEKLEYNLGENTYVFCDMVNSHNYDYYFVIHKNIIFLKSKPSFWNDTEDPETTYFILENVPNDLLLKGIHFFDHRGQVNPPFMPEEVYTWRMDIPLKNNSVSKTVFFKRDNRDLNDWLKEMNTYVTNGGKQIEQLPSWLADDETVMALLKDTHDN